GSYSMCKSLLLFYTIYYIIYNIFSFQSSCNHRDLHSFPTRRSSDLHFARDCTTTALESIWFFTGNRTGLSIPFKSSLMPVPSKMTKGHDNLKRFNFSDKALGSDVLIKSIAFSVSRLSSMLWYITSLTPIIIDY